ncbi:MAG: hypothetical protein EAX96_09550 [Candidatus Lokiarchaeota archaeon]|nr:hypothetical protein [Candidatus Lokiarchaeota archaeon]
MINMEFIIFFIFLGFWGLEIIFIAFCNDYLSLIIISIPFFLSILILINILFMFSSIYKGILIGVAIIISLLIFIQFFSIFLTS